MPNPKATPLTGRPRGPLAFGPFAPMGDFLHRIRRKAITANLAEARDLDEWMGTVLDHRVPGYSPALLGRALVRRDLALMGRQQWLMWVGAIPLMLPLFIFFIPFLRALEAGDGSDQQSLFSVIAYYVTILACGFLVGRLRKDSPDQARRRHYWPGSKPPPAAQWALISFLSLFVLALVAALVWLGWSMGRDRLIQASINSVGALLWLLTVMLIVAFIGRRGSVIRRVPDAELIRVLATACFVASRAKPAQWGDIRYRRTIAGEIALAAGALELSSLRALKAIGIGPDNSEWKLVCRAAAGLRSLAARVVTGNAETRAKILCSLAVALQAAVAGNVARMEGALPAVSAEAPGSWFAGTLAFVRRLALAFLPAALALGLIIGGERFGWTLAADARPILIQFAILSTLVGLMSAFDPLGYQQRLGSITGAGGSLFGWGKARS